MPSETLILQAYEADRRPAWIDACLASVRRWSEANGFGYHFTTDFFGRIPGWFRDACGAETGPLTDLARVLLMEEQLAPGRTVVWVDADVLAFDPAALALPDVGFFAIDEVSVLRDPASGRPQLGRGINGALLGATQGDPRLALYRSAIGQVVRDRADGSIPRTIAGPVLLTHLAERLAIDRIGNVGLLTPLMIDELHHGAPDLVRTLMLATGRRLAAANLCHFAAALAPDRAYYDMVMERVIERLLATRGALLNDLL